MTRLESQVILKVTKKEKNLVRNLQRVLRLQRLIVYDYYDYQDKTKDHAVGCHDRP